MQKGNLGVERCETALDILYVANEPIELDYERVVAATVKIGDPVRELLKAEPPARDNVYVVLNALAACASLVILGTGKDAAEAFGFFNLALAQSLEGQSEGAQDIIDRMNAKEASKQNDRPEG